VLAGFATDNCVMFTAADAYMRDFKVVLPTDCLGAQSMQEHRNAIKRMKSLLKARVATSTQVRLTR
jgi:nicotinamidase-related amidase